MMKIIVILLLLTATIVVNGSGVSVQCDGEDGFCTASCRNKKIEVDSNDAVLMCPCEGSEQYETIVNFSKDILEELADIKQQYEDFNSQILNLLETLHKPKSCSEVKQRWPNSPSSFYDITNSTGYVENVYCHMTELCGSDGPWTRVAHLNMSNPSEECPEGFHEYNWEGVKSCGRVGSEGSCQPVKFPTNELQYTQVCGRVHGYAHLSTDGVFRHDSNSENNINAPYIDGVSLTYGYPRKHLWSFFAAHEGPGRSCPCSSLTSLPSPSIVGEDYYCESRNPPDSDDVLWDGKDCWTQEEDCCKNPNLPWFSKTLPEPTSDYIELRVCCDQESSNEDAPVSYYEIYVK